MTALEQERLRAEARSMTVEQLREAHSDALDGLRLAGSDESFRHFDAVAREYVAAYAQATRTAPF